MLLDVSIFDRLILTLMVTAIASWVIAWVADRVWNTLYERTVDTHPFRLNALALLESATKLIFAVSMTGAAIGGIIRLYMLIWGG
jgi:hypothetical protein